MLPARASLARTRTLTAGSADTHLVREVLTTLRPIDSPQGMHFSP